MQEKKDSASPTALRCTKTIDLRNARPSAHRTLRLQWLFSRATCNLKTHSRPAAMDLDAQSALTSPARQTSDVVRVFCVQVLRAVHQRHPMR